jgi:hypothetical protein
MIFATPAQPDDSHAHPVIGSSRTLRRAQRAQNFRDRGGRRRHGSRLQELASSILHFHFHSFSLTTLR